MALYQERNEAIEANRGKTYVPNGKAEDFIKMVGGGEKFVSMFIAANGVGKSAAGANIIANIVFGVQSKHFDQPVFNNWPYAKTGRIISDPTTIKEKIIPELTKWFPSNEAKNIPEANFEESKEGKNYVCKIETNTGWTIDIMSTEQQAKEFESTDLAFVWIDEPMPRDKFMATLARGRLGMLVFWTFTPLTYSAWIKDWMDSAVQEGYADYVEAEVEDNCKVHGVRGILEHVNIKRMVDAMTEEEREARAFGKFGHLIGRVHKQFSRKIHVIKPFQINVKDYTMWKAIDPHPRVPDHVLYMAIDRQGTKFITSEMLGEGHVKDLYARMKAHENEMNYRIEGRIIDPAAYVDDQHNREASVGKQLFDLGETDYIRGAKDLMAGIKRTNDALNYELKEGTLIRQPEIYIFDTCPITIKQLDEYVWVEIKGPSRDDKKQSAKPRDRDDHMPENLHRLLLAEPTFIPYTWGKGNQSPDLVKEELELDPYHV